MSAYLESTGGMAATPAGMRLALDSRKAEAESSGRHQLAEAYGRLILMTEVCECLGSETPDAAEDAAEFCAKAMDRLGDAGDDEEPSFRLLRETESRWGVYLSLLSDVADSAEIEIEESYGRDDLPAAIDAETLCRLLTGMPSSGDPRESAIPSTAFPAQDIPYCPPASPMMSELTDLTAVPELRETFLEEAYDLFDRIQSLVLSLEPGRDEGKTLEELGRCLHTLKGAAGSVGLGRLAARVHSIEEGLRGIKGEATEDKVEALLGFLRDVEGAFAGIRHEGKATPPVAQTSPSAGPPDRPDVANGTTSDSASCPAPAPTASEIATAVDHPGEGPVRVSAERFDELMDLASELIARRGLWAAQAETLKEFTAKARNCRQRLMATVDQLRGFRPSRENALCELAELVQRLSEQSDDLVMLAEGARPAADPQAENADALARLTLRLWGSLQEVRIVPVRALFQRLARVAYDAARVEGRRVKVVMVGEETGLDRALQDRAFEPLLHVVRNAVGHGIEPAAERTMAGKLAEGLVTLEAARAGSAVVLTVRDDGRGLDFEAIAAKGRRLGLIGVCEELSPQRLMKLIFHPGFSTRPEANAISGRGVGMDVVGQEVARLHGSIDLSSEPGQGTTLVIRLPSRLALEQSIIFRVDGQAFAVPVELIERAQPFEDADVDRDGGAARVQVNGRWVPLVSGPEALGMARHEPVSCPKLLLIRAGGEMVAMIVDAIDGTRELVIKPLGQLLAGHPVVSGTSLSVDGEVILALDPLGLVARTRPAGSGLATPPCRMAVTRATSILVVDDSISVRNGVVRQLRAHGHEVGEASDGLEALDRLKSRVYELVLSDLEMPRMDGFELLAELRRPGIGLAPPVVVSSSRSDAETRRRVLALGAREFIAKPIGPEALAEKVCEVLRGLTMVMADSGEEE